MNNTKFQGLLSNIIWLLKILLNKFLLENCYKIITLFLLKLYFSLKWLITNSIIDIINIKKKFGININILLLILFLKNRFIIKNYIII